ncbi:hypothetical protein [Pseudoduganella sp. UC29_71]|uniref:hypothetical protein n=1 Tax=Pseudoduganella sp. UC29_71 TaxID=3350174 RepID=UPI00366EAC06
MPDFSDRVRAAANFEVAGEQTRLFATIGKVREDAIRTNNLSSSRVAVAIMEACVNSFRKCGEIIWTTCAHELRSDVFYVLGCSEKEIIENLSVLLDNLLRFHIEAFNVDAENVISNLGMSLDKWHEPIYVARVQAEQQYEMQVKQLFSLARGNI